MITTAWFAFDLFVFPSVSCGVYFAFPWSMPVVDLKKIKVGHALVSSPLIKCRSEGGRNLRLQNTNQHRRIYSKYVKFLLLLEALYPHQDTGAPSTFYFVFDLVYKESLSWTPFPISPQITARVWNDTDDNLLHAHVDVHCGSRCLPFGFHSKFVVCRVINVSIKPQAVSHPHRRRVWCLWISLFLILY